MESAWTNVPNPTSPPHYLNPYDHFKNTIKQMASGFGWGVPGGDLAESVFAVARDTGWCIVSPKLSHSPSVDLPRRQCDQRPAELEFV